MRATWRLLLWHAMAGALTLAGCGPASVRALVADATTGEPLGDVLVSRRTVAHQDPVLDWRQSVDVTRIGRTAADGTIIVDDVASADVIEFYRDGYEPSRLAMDCRRAYVIAPLPPLPATFNVAELLLSRPAFDRKAARPAAVTPAGLVVVPLHRSDDGKPSEGVR